MAHNQRIEEIHRLIQTVQKVRVAELAGQFNTSTVTIRKDLEILERQGVLLRTHGGAVLAEDRQRTIPFSAKIEQNVATKSAIAKRAAELVHEARTVLLDAGSTTLALARLLGDRPVTIITNSLIAAIELSPRPSGAFMLLGGDWRAESSAFIGPFTLDMLDNLNADVAFIGASGFDVDHGFTCQNSIESQVKQRMLARAHRRYILADSAKCGVTAFSTFARPADVNALITDDRLPESSRGDLEAAGLYVITAESQGG